MDAPTSHDVNGASAQMMSHHRTMSFSQQSQTAQELVAPLLPCGHRLMSISSFIADQLQLEADARETLPYVREPGALRAPLRLGLTED